MGRYGGGCVAAAEGEICFVPGSEVIQPFLIVAESTIVDISPGAVTAELVAYGSVAFAPSVDIENPAPAPEPDQQPHGTVTLSEEQTATIPDGSLLRVVYVQNGVTMPALGWRMKRVA